MSKKPETTMATHCDAAGCGEKIVEGGKRHMIVKDDRVLTLFRDDGEAFSFVTLPAGDYHISCGIESESKTIRMVKRDEPKLPFPEDKK